MRIRFDFIEKVRAIRCTLGPRRFLLFSGLGARRCYQRKGANRRTGGWPRGVRGIITDIRSGGVSLGPFFSLPLNRNRATDSGAGRVAAGHSRATDTTLAPSSAALRFVLANLEL